MKAKRLAQEHNGFYQGLISGVLDPQTSLGMFSQWNADRETSPRGQPVFPACFFGWAKLSCEADASSQTQGQLVGAEDFACNSPEFFLSSVLTYPAPTNCPWVSEDETACYLRSSSSAPRITSKDLWEKFAVYIMDEAVVKLKIIMWTIFSTTARGYSSSETQDQLVGAGKSLIGREKNSGKEKSRRRRRSLFFSLLTFLCPNFFLARLNFFPPPLTAPVSRRMGATVSTGWIACVRDSSGFLYTLVSERHLYLLADGA